MAQGYGLGNAFSDIMNSYRNRVLANQDRQYELELPGVEAQNRASIAAADEAERVNERGKNAQNMQIYMDNFGFGPPTVADVNDVLAGDRSKETGLRAMFANPNVVSAFEGQVDDIFILPGSENRPEGPLYGVGVKNPNTGTRGPVTSGRGTAGDETVAIYDAKGLQDMLEAGYSVAAGESGIAPRGLISQTNAAMRGGRSAEQSTVVDIDPRQFAINAPEMQEVEQQRAAQNPPSQTQNNAARLGQLQDASASLASQIAEQSRIVSGLDDVPVSQDRRDAAEARLGQLQNQKAQIDERIDAETPRPDTGDAPDAQPQQAPDVNALLDSSAGRVQAQARALAAPFIDMAQQGADQRNAAAAYTGNSVTDRQLGSILTLQSQGQLQPAQASNIIGSGDPSGSREQRITNRMNDGSGVMTGSMETAGGVVENVNDNETSRLDNTLTTLAEMQEAKLDAINEARDDARTDKEKGKKADREQIKAWEDQGKRAARARGYDGLEDRIGANYARAASSSLITDPVIVGPAVSNAFVSQDLAPAFADMEKAISDFNRGSRTVSGQNLLERTWEDNFLSVAGRNAIWGNNLSPQDTLHLTFLAQSMGVNPKDVLVKVIDPAVSAVGNNSRITPRRLRAAIAYTSTNAYKDLSPNMKNLELVELLSMNEERFKKLTKKLFETNK